MRNLAFVIWMLGFPLVSSIGEYLAYMRERRYSDGVLALSAAIMLVIWGWVGHLLYEGNKP